MVYNLNISKIVKKKIVKVKVVQVMSDSLQPHRLYGPWNSPGQNPGIWEPWD